MIAAKKRVLFLCTANAIRSQMAEGIARAFHGDQVDAFSAGAHAGGWVHPLAVASMAEIGIDISGAESKGAAQFFQQPFDAVVTLCDNAAESCPNWPNAKRLEHWSIGDPTTGPGETRTRFASVRENLIERIARLVQGL